MTTQRPRAILRDASTSTAAAVSPFTLTLLVAATLAVTSCPECAPARDAGPEPGPWPLDVPLGAGDVRCGRVTQERELIGGPGAYGVVGRSFRCYNRQIRFLVQDASAPRATSAYGGTLIDVDLVRDSEDEPGADFFREHISAFGFQEIEVESVEVIDDGRSSERGVIRISGRPAPISVVPQASALSQDLPVRVETDIILLPDESTIEIKTRLINETDEQLTGVLYSDLVFMGLAERAFTPEYGFDRIPLFGTVSFFARGGSGRLSYGYVCSPGDDPLILFSEAGGQISACSDDGFVGVDGEYSRYIVIGDGTVDSVARQAWKIRGDDVAEVTGTVIGSERGGALVSAFVGESIDAENARVINQTVADGDGVFSMALPPGTWRLMAHIESRARSDGVLITLPGGNVTGAVLTLPEDGELTVSTSFEDRNGTATPPLPSKLSLLPLDGARVPNAALGEFDEGGLLQMHTSVNGAFSLRAPPGRYRLYVTRGFEFSRYEEEIDILAGETVNVAASIQHVLDTDGLVGAEFHQHTLGSFDATAPIGARVLENAAEGIELAAATDHDTVIDFQPWVDAHGLSEHLVVYPGDEISYQGIGHINAWPWVQDPDDPTRDNGVSFWFGRTLPEIIETILERSPGAIVQNNHPRNPNFGWFFTSRLNPVDATRMSRGAPTNDSYPEDVYEWTAAFDAIEVNASIGPASLYTEDGAADLAAMAEDDPASVYVFADWLAFLGAGIPIAATGNSDSHHTGEGLGYPRTYLRVGVDAPPSVTDDMMRDAIRGQRTLVAQGCLVELMTAGERPMGLDESIAAQDAVAMRVRVQAPGHVSGLHLELFVNGRAQPLSENGGAVSIDVGGTLELPLSALAGAEVVRADAPLGGLPSDEDLVIVAAARGGTGLVPTGGADVFCFSAPLYVDGGPLGWTGWLEDGQQLR